MHLTTFSVPFRQKLQCSVTDIRAPQATAPTLGTEKSTPTLCSLNGVQSPGSGCVCRAGWTGSDCQFLKLPAVDPTQPQGYGRTPNVTSWGASVLAGPNISNPKGVPLYHLFVTEESGGCGMSAWRTNSQVG